MREDSATANSMTTKRPINEVIDLTCDDDERAPQKQALKERKVKLVTYNIDGLNPHHLEERTRAAVALVLSEDADVIFFQEVVASTAPILMRMLRSNGYCCSDGAESLGTLIHYFNLSFVKICRFSRTAFQRVEFPQVSSMQGRVLLKCTAAVDGVDLLAINLHLESTGRAFQSPESATRMGQLEAALSALDAHSGPALAGGDLNIRDPEARAVMAKHRAVDAMEVIKPAVGSNNTWFMPGNSKVSCRFDRVYCNERLRPISYRTIGDEEVLDSMEGGYLTPSDHRGLVIEFLLTVPEGSGARRQSVDDQTQRQEQAEAHQTKKSRREIMIEAVERRMQASEATSTASSQS